MSKLMLACVAVLLCNSASTQEPKFKSTPSSTVPVSFNASYSNYKTKYFVLKKDSTGILVNSKIYRDDQGGRFYLNDHDKSDVDHRIYADETLKISFQDNRNGQTIEGLSKDSCWLFKFLSGKISLYSFYPPPDIATNECLNAFQVDENPIEMGSIEKLLETLESNQKAKAIFLKQNAGNTNYIKGVQKFNQSLSN